MALTTSVPQVNAKRATYRQRRMGPAPFASLEDLSDEQDSPPPSGGGAGGGKLPGIREDPPPPQPQPQAPPQPAASLHTPSTPRIDISRASSSSHHDSNNSSPERELFAGEVPCKLGLGFKEDAADLRSSTEELDLGDDEPVGCEERPRSRRGSARSARGLARPDPQGAAGRPRGGSLSKCELDAAAAARDRERKDSLSIVSTGRTSRLSSVGSAASAASSAASHLSVASSGGGRSPSPHKMLLETSFCGSKPLLTQPSIELDELPASAKEAIAQVDGSLLGAAAADGSRPASRRSSGGEGDGARRRRRRADEGPPLILPNVSPVVSPAERELLAAKERALAEEVVRELESRRAEKPAAPASLSLSVSAPPGTAPSRTPSASPKPSRRPQRGALRDADSRTPSPGSVSRKSSFASLFRRGGGGGSGSGGGETPSTVVSPESPTGSTGVRRNKSGSFSTILGDGFRERSRSRSKSRERQPPQQQQEGKPRAKGVFSALFKKKDRKRAGHAEPASPGDLPSPESRVPQQAAEPLATVEFKFDAGAEAEAPAPAASQPPAAATAAVVHRPERRGSGGGGGGAGAEEAQAHRRAASSKRRAMHEAQLLPAESQGLADVIAGSALDRSTSAEADEQPPPPPPHKKSQQQQQQQQHQQQQEHQQQQQQQQQEQPERPPAEPPRQQRTPFRSEREQQQHLSELRKLKPRRPDSQEAQQQQQQQEAQQQQQQQQQQEAPAAAAGVAEPQESVAVEGARPDLLAAGAAEERLPSLDVDSSSVAHQALSEEASPAGSAVLPAQGAAPASTEEERMSSDSEAEFARVAAAVLGAEPAPLLAAPGGGAGAEEADGDEAEVEAERLGLVLQDSFEGELPYVPTTLPQERSVAVPIMPVRQRSAAEVRTCPIERPRSTTPINPALLDEYVQHEAPAPAPPAEKMRIQLPRPLAAPATHDAASAAPADAGAPPQLPRARSPRSRTPSGRSWFEFAEQGAGLQSPREGRKPSLSASSPSPPPPPLPPRANPPPPPPPPPQPAAAPAAPARQWINFEEIPEKRKPPRRIQTLPAAAAGPPVVYSYVDPEECECECHETSGGKGRSHSAASTTKKKKDKDKDRDKERDREKTKNDERARSRSRSRSHSRSREIAAGDGKAANVNKEQRQAAPTPSPTAESHHPHHQQSSSSAGGDRLEVTDVADRNSYLSDSSYEFPNSYSIDTSDYSDGLKPMKPFGMDLDVTSNRSSIISQDETQSPEVGSPNGNETKHRQ